MPSYEYEEFYSLRDEISKCEKINRDILNTWSISNNYVKTLKEQFIAYKQAKSELASKHKEICSEFEIIKTENILKKQNLNNLQEQVLSLEEEIQELDLRKDEMEKENREKLENVNVQIKFAEKILGITVGNSNRKALYIIFTKISRKDPSKQYVIEVECSGTYRVVRAMPEIHDIQELEEKLNKCHSGTEFFMRLRKAFLSLES